MRKVALVIGVGEYADGSNLPNAINDAIDVRNALEQIGFNAGEAKLNLTCRNIKHTLIDFEESFTSGDLVLFYFAGHGTQWEDQNYLIPSDNFGINGTDLHRRAINAQDILNQINSKKPLATIFILDCCRKYHLRNVDIDKRDRATSINRPKGLKEMSNEHESLIVFACAAGTTADDDKKGRNGLFTKHFLKHIYSQNEHIQMMLLDVISGVKQESNSQQIPCVYSSLSSKRLFLNETLNRERSPFTINVSGQNSNRFRESITRKRRAADIAHIDSQCELPLKIPGTSPFDMSAYVISPSGRVENCEIVDHNDYNYSIKFIPKEMGVHTIGVKHKDVHIPGSPFEFTVGQIQSGGAYKVRASGNGLIRGEVNVTNEFSIYTREAGAGRLAIAVEGPAKALIEFFDRKDGSCGVAYICPEPGEYQISVEFNDEHIPESPYRVVVGQTNADRGRATASGTGLCRGEVGQPCEFLIDTCTTNAGAGALAITVNGPSKVQLDCREVAEGYRAAFIPTAPGDYLIKIKFAGTNIAGSPFKCTVGSSGLNLARTSGNDDLNSVTSTSPSPSRAQCSQENTTTYLQYDTIEERVTYCSSSKTNNYSVVDASRVHAQGEGLIRAYINQKATFNVDTREGGNAMLMVGVFGPKCPCEEVFIKHMGSNQYNVQYTVREKGGYMLVVKWGDQHIPGSPWRIEVV